MTHNEPTAFRAPIYENGEFQGHIVGSGNRSYNFRVDKRSATEMSGTLSIQLKSGYFVDGDPKVGKWRTEGTSATGTWTARRVTGRRPSPQMKGYDFCAADNSAIKQIVSDTFCQAIIKPGWCGAEGDNFIPDACIFGEAGPLVPRQ